MAVHLLSLVFPLLIFLVSAHGRSLQKNCTSQNINLLYNNVRVLKAVYPASYSYTGKTNYNNDNPTLKKKTNTPTTPSKKKSSKKKRSKHKSNLIAFWVLVTTIPGFAVFLIAFWVFANFCYKTKIPAAINAEASKPEPVEEIPINAHPKDMSP